MTIISYCSKKHSQAKTCPHDGILFVILPGQLTYFDVVHAECRNNGENGYITNYIVHETITFRAEISGDQYSDEKRTRHIDGLAS